MIDTLGHEDQLERFFDIYEESLNMELSICLVGSVASHFTTVSLGMREDLNILVSDMTAWLVKLLDAGSKIGIFNFRGGTDGMGNTIISGMAASLKLSRVNGAGMFHSVKSNFRLQLALDNT